MCLPLSSPAEAVSLLILFPVSGIAFTSAPTGACPEAAAAHHRVVSPRAFLGKTTLSAVAAQGAQLFWGRQGKCEFGCTFVDGEQSLFLAVKSFVRKTPSGNSSG